MRVGCSKISFKSEIRFGKVMREKKAMLKKLDVRFQIFMYDYVGLVLVL